MQRSESTFELRPASVEESGLFYALTEEQDEELGCIGHLRLDFGRSGDEFWHSWHPRANEALNTKEFGGELDDVVNQLRGEGGPLHSRASMSRYCSQHGGAIEGGWMQSYGYVIETENYKYYLRCKPQRGDYDGYLTCFDKSRQQIIGRISFAGGECEEFRDARAYLTTIKEELPYRSTTGFRFETLTKDPQVRKAVDDIIFDMCGEENPSSIEDYSQTQGMHMGGM